MERSWEVVFDEACGTFFVVFDGYRYRRIDVVERMTLRQMQGLSVDEETDALAALDERIAQRKRDELWSTIAGAISR